MRDPQLTSFYDRFDPQSRRGAHATEIMDYARRPNARYLSGQAAHPLHVSIGVSNCITIPVATICLVHSILRNSNQLHHTRSHLGHLNPTPYRPDTRPTYTEAPSRYPPFPTPLHCSPRLRIGSSADLAAKPMGPIASLPRSLESREKSPVLSSDLSFSKLWLWILPNRFSLHSR